MQKIRPFYWGIIISIIAISLDQLSKYMIVHHVMTVRNIIEILPVFDLVLVYNKGISFGLFSQNHPLGVNILASVSLIITLILIVWMWRQVVIYEIIALGLIIGGAIGNVIDRIRVHAVVDFLHIHWHQYSFPAFNIADACITLGAALMLIHNFLSNKDSVSR